MLIVRLPDSYDWVFSKRFHYVSGNMIHVVCLRGFQEGC